MTAIRTLKNMFASLCTFLLLQACTNGSPFPTTSVYTFPGLKKINVEGNGSLLLSWEKVPNVEATYAVFRRASSGTFDWDDAVGTTTTNSFKHEAYTLEKSYCFAVRYVHPELEPDANTTEVCPAIPSITSFVGISALTATDTGQVTASWVRATEDGVKGYNVYVGEGFKSLAASLGSDVSSAVINNLAVDETFSFGVRVVDSLGREDTNTKTLSVKTLNNVAPTFEGIKTATQVTGDSIKLTWLAASGSPKEYRIYSAQAAANGTPVVSFTTPLTTITAPTTSATISGLGDELAHGFVVRSVSSGGQEDKNVVQQNVVLPDVGAPVFSGLKTFSFSQGGAQLTWDAAVGETTKYRVYYKEGTASAFTFGSATIADVTAPSTGTTISGLLDNRDWTFAVRAFDSHNQADTNVVTKTVTAGDLTPAAFTGYVGIVALGETSLSIEFNRSVETDISHYSIRIKRSGTADTFTEKTTASQVGSGTITKTITGLLPATSYDVIVKVIDTADNPSTNSSFLTRATLDQTPPTFNGITSVAAKTGDVSKTVVTWSAASDVGGVSEYRVYYSRTTLVGQALLRTGTFPSGTGNATIYMSNAVTSGTSLEVPGLTEGVVYYFVVHAIDASGNEETNTAQAAYTVPFYTPPQPPTSLSILGGNGPSTNRSPFINFTSTAGYKVKIYVNGTFNVLKVVNTTGADTVQLAILPNTSGNYVVTAAHINQSEVEGNTAAVATYQLFVDIPTASLSGTPSTQTNANALAVTVSNASNVSHYKYSLLTNQSTACSAATYSVTWVAVATQITDSLSSDGPYRLCVIAKNTSNLEQDPASATVADFTRDTAPPAAPATLTLTNPITSSTSITYTPLVNATVASVAGASAYCVTPTNSAPSSGDACWTASTSTTVTLTGNNAYAWSKKSSGQVSASSTSATITYTNICNSGSLATGQTCTVSSAKTVNDGDEIAGQGNMTISATGSITGNANERFTITLSGNFTISSGGSVVGNATISAANVNIQGTINATEKGYQGVAGSAGSPGSSGGAGSAAVWGGGGALAAAGGASYLLGSAGGTANVALNASQPTIFGGSGGASTSGRGGHGGGAIKITASGTLTLDGTVSANGGVGAGSPSGAGAGGSIWLTAGSIAGTGNLNAKGWYSQGYGGGGSGGAIAISSSNPFKGTINVDAGISGSEQATPPGQGKLTVAYTNPCDSGTLSTTCTISGPVVWGTSQTFTATGNLVIANGGSLKAPAKAQTIAINVTGDITVEAGGSIVANLSDLSCTNLTVAGTISADGLGYYGTSWYSLGATGTYGYQGNLNVGGGGGGHGGRGGVSSYFGGGGGMVKDGSYGSGASYIGGLSHGSATQPTTFGGAGGGNIWAPAAASTGGGALKLSVSGTATVNGTISANGVSGTGNGGSVQTAGGGAGGSIWITAPTLSGTGTIIANGGNGGASSITNASAGGGAGGRIATYNTNKFAGTIRAYGGTAGNAIAGAGEPGTVYFPNNSDNYCNIGTFATDCTINQVWAFYNGWTLAGTGNLTIASGGQLYNYRTESANLTVTSGNLTIQNGGSVKGNFVISATNVTIDSGGSLDADLWGYLGAYGSNGLGYQAGAWGTVSVNSNGGGGGAHGGNGGAGGGSSAGGAAGTAYGSASAPTTFGSAGGGNSGGVPGASGGGAIKVTASSTITLNGTITAIGGTAVAVPYAPGGGGAGGSIWLQAPTLTGNGTINANGGAGGNGVAAGIGFGGGGGGGGRIKFSATTDSFTGSGTKTANGGASGNATGTAVAGSAGTIQ